MKTTSIIGTLVVGLLLAGGVVPAGAAVMITDTFENDVLNPSPRLGLGTVPPPWGTLNTVSNANGIADVSVENVGSPFAGGGSRSMLFYDNGTAVGQIYAQRYIAPQTNETLHVQFDVRFNDFFTNPGGYGAWNLSMYTDANEFAGGLGLTTSGNGVNGTLYSASGPTIMTVSTGVWYQIHMVLAPANSGIYTMQVSVVDFPTLTTNTLLTAQGVTGTLSGGYLRAIFTSAFGPAAQIDANIDSFAMFTVPEPGTTLLLVVGSVLVCSQRRQSRGSRRHERTFP